LHFNYRYFETEDTEAVPGQWWFGGTTNITPCYVVEEDMKYFHGVYKTVCDRHEYSYHDMKRQCDEYFTITHRGETRGLGGIMYENLNDRDKEDIFAFSSDAANRVVESYVPIVKKHMRDSYSPRQMEWQQVRRGRYIEFNFLCDRGVKFGLETGGRVESILMTTPLAAQWHYDYQVDPHGPEQKFLDAVRTAKSTNWV
jgi:coproporphyrinogen III oxidase